MIKTYGESSYSSSSCSKFGNHGVVEYCKQCSLADWCEGVTEASKAPLDILPQYLASKYYSVRRAAKARFIELEEEAGLHV